MAQPMVIGENWWDVGTATGHLSPYHITYVTILSGAAESPSPTLPVEYFVMAFVRGWYSSLMLEGQNTFR